MKEGMIVQSGKYENLIADSTGELHRHVVAHTKSLNEVDRSQDCSLKQDNNTNDAIEEKEKFHDLTSSDHGLFDRTQEETETGRVKWKVYSIFVTAAYKGALVAPVLLCHILFQGLQIASNYWITWGSETEGKISKEKLLRIFVLLSGGSSIFILGRAVLLSTIAVETAQQLFAQMTKSVFRAPLSFFDSTPSSRILNRVSRYIHNYRKSLLVHFF